MRSVLKERGQHGIVNLAESDKGSFYNQKEWLEEDEYGKGMFYSEYSDDLRSSASIFSNKFANVFW